MKTAIDRAGRVVIPKAMREALGLAGGGSVEVTVRDGRIEIEPTSVSMRVVDADGYPVIQAESELPPLTAEMVRATVEHVRR
jgi:AbrB family looped-hinge helix DNA binding protein